jgi:hypothetical protein
MSPCEAGVGIAESPAIGNQEQTGNSSTIFPAARANLSNKGQNKPNETQPQRDQTRNAFDLAFSSFR